MNPLLRHLRDVNAFDHQPAFDVMRAYHVPFEELADVNTIETRFEEAALRGGRIALIGPSGCGKSSVISHVLGDETKQLASFVIPVSSVSPDLMTEPTSVADRMISLIGRTAKDQGLIDEEEERSALVTATSEKTVRTGRDVKGSVGLSAGWIKGELAADLTRQVEAAVSITPEEKLEVVNQILVSIAGDGLNPVLVFDDTDRWISGVGIESPKKVVESFFGRVVRWVAELGSGLVVAVHDSYFDQVPRGTLLETFDTTIDIPALPDVEAVEKVVGRRVSAATEETEFASASIADVFEEGAAEGLFNMYVDTGNRLRWLIRTVHMALTEACDAGDDRVTLATVSAAGVADL